MWIQSFHSLNTKPFSICYDLVKIQFVIECDEDAKELNMLLKTHPGAFIYGNLNIYKLQLILDKYSYLAKNKTVLMDIQQQMFNDHFITTHHYYEVIEKNSDIDTHGFRDSGIKIFRYQNSSDALKYVYNIDIHFLDLNNTLHKMVLDETMKLFKYRYSDIKNRDYPRIDPDNALYIYDNYKNLGYTKL